MTAAGARMPGIDRPNPAPTEPVPRGGVHPGGCDLACLVSGGRRPARLGADLDADTAAVDAPARDLDAANWPPGVSA